MLWLNSSYTDINYAIFTDTLQNSPVNALVKHKTVVLVYFQDRSSHTNLEGVVRVLHWILVYLRCQSNRDLKPFQLHCLTFQTIY